jgi:SAM-dependent methyltransferase
MPPVSASHWNWIHRGRPYQSPSTQRYAQIAAGVKTQLFGADVRVLALTVMPALADIGLDLTAVDRFEPVVRSRWPGNTPTRRAIVGDWFALPFADSSFSACVGDGSINALAFPDGVRLFYDSIGRVLQPGGTFVCRMYLTPDATETTAAVSKAVWQGELQSFVYFKFRLAMAIVAGQANPSISVQSIHAAFDAIFPNRDRLAAATGWNRDDIDSIDFYKSSPEIYNFPTRQQALSIIPSDFSNARFIPVGTYELAERCPLLVMEKN